MTLAILNDRNLKCLHSIYRLEPIILLMWTRGVSYPQLPSSITQTFESVINLISN